MPNYTYMYVYQRPAYVLTASMSNFKFLSPLECFKKAKVGNVNGITSYFVRLDEKTPNNFFMKIKIFRGSACSLSFQI